MGAALTIYKRGRNKETKAYIENKRLIVLSSGRFEAKNGCFG
jgi:hypothetical protein